MKKPKIYLGLSGLQMEALKAAAEPNAVIWPRSCKKVRQYASGEDGRVHFEAPVDDAFALYDSGFIDTHGCITDAGRKALSMSSTERASGPMCPYCFGLGKLEAPATPPANGKTGDQRS